MYANIGPVSPPAPPAKASPVVRAARFAGKLFVPVFALAVILSTTLVVRNAMTSSIPPPNPHLEMICKVQAEDGHEDPDCAKPHAQMMRHGHHGGSLTGTGAAHLPLKYAVPLVPPRKYQGYRGTCWDFATIAVVEHLYRMQGYLDGLLDRDEYMQFSEQAYGREMVTLCAASEEAHKTCTFGGDMVAFGSTEGGEVPLLAYFAKQLANRLFPGAICPYPAEGGHDMECPDVDRAAQAGNPLRFEMVEMTTHYERSDIKNALVSGKRALALSMSDFDTHHFLPCTGALLADPACHKPATEQCATYCPVGAVYYPTACCKKIKTEMYNLDGEFYSNHGDMTLSGGHCMLLAGYTDTFLSRHGYRGGYILRNSWRDGLNWKHQGPRASHSMGWFLQKISDVDERQICPNDHNPYSWFACNGADCLTKETVESAAAILQPLVLKCRIEDECDMDATYYLKSIDEYLNTGLQVVCFNEQHKNATAAGGLSFGTLCTPPSTMAAVANMIQPEVVRLNHDDACGFYFLPYQVADEVTRKFGSIFATGFDMRFDRCSYPKAGCDNVDYSWAKESTHRQETFRFPGPFPNKHTTLTAAQ